MRQRGVALKEKQKEQTQINREAVEEIRRGHVTGSRVQRALRDVEREQRREAQWQHEQAGHELSERDREQEARTREAIDAQQFRF